MAVSWFCTCVYSRDTPRAGPSPAASASGTIVRIGRHSSCSIMMVGVAASLLLQGSAAKCLTEICLKIICEIDVAGHRGFAFGLLLISRAVLESIGPPLLPMDKSYSLPLPAAVTCSGAGLDRANYMMWVNAARNCPAAGPSLADGAGA